MQAAINRNAIKTDSSWNIFSSLGRFYRYRDLLRQLILRNIRSRHKGSYLGSIWQVLNPLLMMMLYTFVFGFIFKGSYHSSPEETKLDYGLGIFLSITIYQFLAEILMVSPTLIVSHSNYVKKVVFPLDVLPVAVVGTALYHFCLTLTIVVMGIVFLGPGLSINALWMPVILFPFFLTALGLAWIFSALGVFFRDINQLTTFLSLALLYASAVFYSSKQIPAIWQFIKFNPLIHSIELSRQTLLWQQSPDIPSLVYLYGFSIVFVWIGFIAFNKMKPAFADVI